jgi:histidine triad (HIT) family protein
MSLAMISISRFARDFGKSCVSELRLRPAVLLIFIVMTDCLFCKIIAGSIPSKKVYEDEKAFAFEDIKPVAPTHVLIIPKKHIVGIDQATEADAELVGYCQLVAATIARERKLEHGFRTVYNVGPHAGQTVFHLHLHLLGGRQMHWPPG